MAASSSSAVDSLEKELELGGEQESPHETDMPQLTDAVSLADFPNGWTAYTQLSATALAVVVRRVDGWCVYCAGVAGLSHEREWQAVLDHGDKLDEGTARAILLNRFFPPIDAGELPYAR